jgi:hypothetical protein
MDEKTWKFEIHATGKDLDKTYSFLVEANEREADLLLDALLMGFEGQGHSVGGGMVEAASEQA